MECKRLFCRALTVQLIVTYIAFGAYLACFITKEWITFTINDTETATAGLFQVCTGTGDNNCSVHVDNGLILKLAQFMCCLGIISFTCLVTLATWQFYSSTHRSGLRRIKFIAALSSLASGVFVATAIILLQKSNIAVAPSLGYSGTIGMASVILSIFLSPFYLYDGMKDRARVSSLDDSSPLDTTMEEAWGEPKLSDSEDNTEKDHITFKSGKYKKYVIPRLIVSPKINLLMNYETETDFELDLATSHVLFDVVEPFDGKGEEYDDFNQLDIEQTCRLFSHMFLPTMENIPKIYIDDNEDRNFDDFEIDLP